MREILFRGKSIEDNKWVYGDLIREKKSFGKICTRIYRTTNNGWELIDVDSKTVGQYTGLNDKNGNKIFEGDIVDFPDRSDSESYGVVEYDTNETEFGIVYDSIYEGLGRQYHSRDIEVIGNIFDNPELLEE
jgi:hypothetical protein